MHIEQVLGDVPADKRCRCREEAASKPSDTRENAGSMLRRFLRF
jgi:hypothetical protein